MDVTKAESTKYTLFIPETFDADAIVGPIVCRADLKQSLKNAMHFILHSIYLGDKKAYVKSKNEKSGFQPLQAVILKKIVGDRYKEARDLLVEHHVIVVDMHAIPGVQSFGYCLIGKYASDQKKIVELPVKCRVRREYSKHVDDNHLKNEQALLQIPYIIKWYNDKITVDLTAVDEFIDIYEREMTMANMSTWDKEYYQTIKNRITLRYNNLTKKADAINSGNFGNKRTGKDNRLHNNLTNVMKEIRPFLRYD